MKSKKWKPFTVRGGEWFSTKGKKDIKKRLREWQDAGFGGFPADYYYNRKFKIKKVHGPSFEGGTEYRIWWRKESNI